MKFISVHLLLSIILTYSDQTLITFGIEFHRINHIAQFIYDAHVTIKQFHLFQVTEEHCRIRFNRAKRFE